MKQRISIEQLNELSDEAKQRLREWWQPNEGDLLSDGAFLIGDSSTWYKIKQRFLPLFSIGQMIEFLTSHLPDSEEYQLLIWKNPKLRTHFRDWNVEYFKDIHQNKHEGHNYTELCDALWEACKSVLEYRSGNINAIQITASEMDTSPLSVMTEEEFKNQFKNSERKPEGN